MTYTYIVLFVIIIVGDISGNRDIDISILDITIDID
jgi:hypothetical protein